MSERRVRKFTHHLVIQMALLTASLFLLSACNVMQPQGAIKGSHLIGLAGQITVSESDLFFFGPEAKTNEDIATFEFEVDSEGEFGFVCSLDGGGYQNCTSPYEATDLLDGNHTFEVQILDRQDNVVGYKAHNWIVDISPPEITLLGTPLATTTETTANFVFEIKDELSEVAGAMCSLNAEAFAPCFSPLALTGLQPGTHELQIIALDGLDNESEPTVFTWVVQPPPAL